MPWGARLAALRAGLHVASPEEALPLAIELSEMAIAPTGGLFLERRRGRALDALEAVVSLWERLPAEARTVALGVGRGRWNQAIADILESPDDDEEARSATSLAAGLGQADMAGPLCRALLREDGKTHGAAEVGLLALSLRARGVAPGALGPEVEGQDLVGVGGFSDRAIEGVERATLDVHLADAAWGFAGHQRRMALVAGLVALDLTGLSAARRDQSGASGPARLLRLVQESSHVAHRALRQIVRWSPAPLVRERAWLLLTEGAIAEAALERVSRAESVEEHESVLRLGHLGLRPARSRLLGMLRLRAIGPATTPPRDASGHGSSPAGTVGDGLELAFAGSGERLVIAPGQLLPDQRMQAALSVSGRRAVPLLAGLIEADDGARVALLREALADSDPVVRLRALAQLPRAELASFCFDADPQVARSAMLRWSTAGLGLRARAEPGERARLCGLLRKSPHAEVRRLADQDCVRETPWDAGSPASRASAWRLAIRDRHLLLSHLRAMVTGGREGVQDGSEWADGAVRAIMVARRLGLTRVIATDLVDLIDPGARSGVPARVAATAAAALGGVDDATCRAALRRALEHSDARVRANAVEAIGVQRLAVEDATTGRDRDYAVLIELRGDADHRVRANAIRALFQSPPACPKERKAGRRAGGVIESKPRVYDPAAVDALGAMLGDERAEHRLAGAWLAGRVLCEGRSRLGHAWSGLSTMVGELRERDADPRVRARAGDAGRRMSAALRACWGGQAAEITGDRAFRESGLDGEATSAIGLVPVEPAGTMG